MRKYILVAIVLVAVGVGVSFFLIPSDTEVAHMQARDQQTVDMGAVDVEAEYNQGRRSFPIISALADKRVAEGNRPAAVTLLEEYVAANPQDVQGRKKLAEQYQLAGRQADFNAQLEAIAAAEPTEANLRVLSDIYNADKNYPKQVEVLKKIVEVTQGQKPEAFVDLATIQVVTGDKDGAMATLAELKSKHPGFESYAVVRIRTTILSEQGKADEAFAEAKAWTDRPIPAANPAEIPPAATPDAVVSAPPTPASQRAKEVADLCNILHYSGNPDKAVALVEPHIALLDESSELVVAYVNANITLGRSEQAWNILVRIDQQGKMVPELYIPYLQLAIKREDIAGAETIANTLNPVQFNEEQALNVIEVARAENAPTVLDILTTRFNEPTVLDGKPVLAAVIAILRDTDDQDQKIEVALNTELSSLQRLRLAESCARASKTQCFDAIIAQYPPIPEMTTPQVSEYAQLFIIAERQKEVIEPIGIEAQKPNAHPDVVFAHIKLAAATGEMDITRPWLEQNANTTTPARMHELFYLANDRKHHAVAVDIAERLYARDPSPMNRDIMIAAWVGAGENEKALPLLREQMQAEGTDDGLYLATLNKLARKSAEYRKELTDYAQAALQSGKGDNRAQVNYAYILLNHGKKEAALPTIRNNAKTQGGEWKKMLAQLTAKPGKGAPAPKLTREQRIAMANSPKISSTNKREIAFSLLNDGYKADATKIFAELAADKGPDSQEVKDLLYMWGGKLNAEQIAWLQARAAASTPYDRARWGELINTYGDDYAVMQYVSSTPDALYNASLRQKYFRVLATSGNAQNFDAGMRNWVAQTTDVPALTDYAKTAQDYGYQEAAANAWRRVDALDPRNEVALNNLAAISFSKGSYTAANQYVDRYLSAHAMSPQPQTNPAQAHFFKAQLLKRAGNMPAAQQEFQQVVSYTSQSPTSAPDALSRLYTSQFHLGQHAQAKAGFEHLLASNPDDKGVLADYMSALIEYNYIDDATRVANQYDKNSPYYGRSSSVIGTSQNVSSIERLSNGREMKIGFSAPIEGQSPINLEKTQQLAWVERTEQGYDSVTISAKPGYEVRFVPTAQEQFAVVPAVSYQYAPQVEQQRQQDLRLQLLYARIEQQTGQTDRARQRLAALQQYYPQDPQLITTQAGVESAAGNTRRAMELIEAAQAASPENEDLAGLVRAARQVDSKQFVKLDHEYRNYGSFHEQLTTLSGVARISGTTEVGMNIANDLINPKVYVDPNTGALRRGSVNRQSAELFVGHYLESGDRLQGSLFSSGHVVDKGTGYMDAENWGLGAYYAFGNQLGRTELFGEYHKPYWDFPEAVLFYATRDRVGAKHYASVNKDLSIGIETSLNNYNMEMNGDNGDSVAQSGLFRLSATYALQQQTRDQAFWGIGYGFDGEYLLDETSTIGGIKPFPFKSRENHQLTGIYRDDWTDSTHALLTAGYLVDRIGEHGPVAEGRITQDLSEQVEAGVRARYGLASSANGSASEDDAVNLGAHIMYKW